MSLYILHIPNDKALISTISTTGTISNLYATDADDVAALEWNPDDQKFYISSGDNFFSFDPTTQITTTIGFQTLPVGQKISSLAYDTLNSIMYGIIYSPPPVQCLLCSINVSNGTITTIGATEPWGLSFTALTYNPIDDVFYMNNTANSTLRMGTIDVSVGLSSYTEIGDTGMTSFQYPEGMAVNLDDGVLYAIKRLNYFSSVNTSTAQYTTISSISDTTVSDITFSNISCVSGDTLIHMSDGDRKRICDLRGGEYVKDYRGGDVEIVKSVKCGKSFDFVEIKRGALGPNQPSEDTYIRKRHPILYKSLETPVESLIEMGIAGEKKFEEPIDVFSLVTKKRTFVVMNNVPVCTVLKQEKFWAK